MSTLLDAFPSPAVVQPRTGVTKEFMRAQQCETDFSYVRCRYTVTPLCRYAVAPLYRSLAVHTVAAASRSHGLFDYAARTVAGVQLVLARRGVLCAGLRLPVLAGLTLYRCAPPPPPPPLRPAQPLIVLPRRQKEAPPPKRVPAPSRTGGWRRIRAWPCARGSARGWVSPRPLQALQALQLLQSLHPLQPLHLLQALQRVAVRGRVTCFHTCNVSRLVPPRLRAAVRLGHR